MSRLLALLAVAAALLAPAAAHAQASPSPYTSAVRYDGMGRVTGTISPDPDNAGWLPFLAARSTYDGAGRLIRVESGSLSAWQSEAVAPANWTGFTVSRSIETDYDASGRKLRATAKDSDGVARTVTQYSYDVNGRLECTAVRMNPAIFGSLPASACTLGTQGTAPYDYGPDRITRNVYDIAGQRVQLREGVGTLDEAAEATWAYSNNSRITAVIDGNGNRAELRYDAYDRQDRWTFPSTTRPGAYNPATQATALASAGSVNAADYEQYGYDANGNRTSLRKRDGGTLSYGYDALNRMTLKVVPERPSGPQALTAGQTRDVYYGYDLRGLQTFARFDSASGDGIANVYDGFGRMTSSRIVMGTTDRTLSYAYDANGNRVRITHPDTTYFTYDMDVAGRLSAIRENGAASGIGVLAVVGYAADGVTGAVVRSNGAVTAYGYDPIGRMNLLLHDLTGSAGDVTWTYGHNPASGLSSQTRNNDSYAWQGHYAVTRAYTTNGLNQYSAAGAAGFTYDANGNLVTSPGPGPGETLTYTFDIENRLVGRSSTGSSPIVTIFYDPLGRLFSSTASGTTTEFLYDGDALVGEYVWGNQTERYVHGNNAAADDPLVWYHGNALGDRRWLATDHQGSIVSLSDGTGASLAINRYDEYGIPASGNQGRFQYTGQIYLPELGMYYYKARIYSPTLGRFLQTDPIGYEGGINLYAYVNDDPVNFVDFDGQNPAAVCLIPAVTPLCIGAVAKTIETAAVVGCFFFCDDIVDAGISAMSGDDEPPPQGHNSDRRVRVPGPPLGPGGPNGPVLTPTDIIVRDQLSQRSLEGARAESRGGTTGNRPRDGRPWDHVEKVRNGQQALRTRIGQINRQLGHPRIDSARRAALQRELSEASRQLERSRRYLPW